MTLSEITVANVGGMPTPAHHDIVVRIVDQGFVAPSEKTLLVPRGLGPGESHTFAEPLDLTLRIFRPQKAGAPLAANETIRMCCELPDARRSFREFEALLPEAAGDIVVRFPVELSKVSSLYSLAPGQAAKLSFTLSNVSEKAFGASAEVKRTLGVRLAGGGGDLADGRVCVFDDRGARIPLADGMWREVKTLAPNAVRTFEAVVAIAPDAEPSTTARLLVSAELGHVESPADARPIQLSELVVRVGRPFASRPADVMLVVNNRTERDELASWESLLTGAGLSPLVWDASLECGMSVLDEPPDVGLVLILNNEMDTADGPRRASVMFDKSVSHALAKSGMHVLYIGCAPELGELLVPTGPTPETVVETMTFVWPWSEPTRAALEKRAHALVTHLCARDTTKRHLVVPRFLPELVQKTLWIRKMKLGTIEVRETTSTTAADLTAIDVDGEGMHGPSLAGEPETRAVVLCALPFPTKVRLLLHTPLAFGHGAKPEGVRDLVVLAVLSDLLAELDAARVIGFRGGVTTAELRAMLPYLCQLETASFASGEDAGAEAKAAREARVVELLAWLDVVRRDLTRVWEFLPGFLWTRRGPLLRSIARRAEDALLAAAFDGEEAQKAARENIRTRGKEIAALLDERRREDRIRKTNRELCRELIDRAKGPRTRSEARELYPLLERVISATQHDEIATSDAARKDRQRALVIRSQEEKTRFLLPRTCGELVAASSQANVAPVRMSP